MDEKKIDEMDSLAAFLHSDGSEKPSYAEKKEPVKTQEPEIRQTVKKPEAKQTVKKAEHTAKRAETKQSELSDINPSEKKGEPGLNDILFSLDSKKKKKPAAVITEPEPDETAVYDYDDDKDEELSDFINIGKPPIHYDEAATQMMNVVNVSVKKSAVAEKIAEEEHDKEDEDAPLTEEEKEEMRQLKAMKVRYEKQRQHIRTFASIFIAALLSVVILVSSAYLAKYIVTFALDLTGIVTNDFRIDVIIPEGADTETVAAILSENNIISSPKFFVYFGEFTKKKDTFLSGTYTLSSTMSYMTIYDTLQVEAYQERIVSIRIVEGMTAREIAEMLEENCICFAEDFEELYMDLQNDYDFEKRLSTDPYKYSQLEGYLFPDTYEFYVVQAMEDKSLHNSDSDKAKAMYKNSKKNAKEVADKIFGNFNDKMTRTMYKKMGEMNMTLDEVITLASMVQKEAANVEDMYYVASVFLNRIRNSESFPKLESDVTILYVENEIKPFIDNNPTRYNALANAYNSYECVGIPSGPICNPGLDAIDAVLNAADTNYFFFCANEDTGEVFYAETKEQHEENLVLAGLR